MAKSDYCARQAIPLFDKFKKENPKLSVWQIAEKIQPLISKIDGARYSINVIIRSVQGRDRNSTVEPLQKMQGLKLDGVSTTPASTITPAMFDRIFNPLNSDEKEFGIPEGNIEPQRFYRIPIPKDNYRVLAIGDAHIPLHCEKTLAHAFRYGREKNVDCILMGGDMLDWYSLSTFEKEAKGSNLQLELETCKVFLQAMRRAFPTQKIIWMDGNHDFRLERAKRRLNGSGFETLKVLQVKELLGLADFNIEYYDNYATLQFGKLNVMHGHKLRGAGAMVAMSKLKNALVNLAFFHHHTVQDAYLKDLLGAVIGSHAIGCCCKPRPDYSIHNTWMNGFGEFIININWDFTVNNFKIINNEVR